MMTWLDTFDIAAALEESHPDVVILDIRFTDLKTWVMALPGFSDTSNRCSEKILEAIQMAWLDERD